MEEAVATAKLTMMAVRAQEIVRSKDIDSFQKLRLLLWLFEQQGADITGEELAEQLFLGDVLMLEDMLAELRTAGLLDCREQADPSMPGRRYALSDQPEVQAALRCLAQIFADPAARQTLLNEIQRQKYHGNQAI